MGDFGLGFLSQGSSCVLGTRPIIAGPLVVCLRDDALEGAVAASTDVGEGSTRAMTGGNDMSREAMAATATRAAALNTMRAGEDILLLLFFAGEEACATEPALRRGEVGRFSPEAMEMSCSLPFLSS